MEAPHRVYSRRSPQSGVGGGTPGKGGWGGRAVSTMRSELPRSQPRLTRSSRPPRKVPIQINVSNALIYLGQLYRSPAEALKEYISNALDEWRRENRAEPCHVLLRFSPAEIAIEYDAPGMGGAEFEDALSRVAQSVKPWVRGVPQIGRLGIGLFAFQQIGGEATFYSRGRVDSRTLRVTLRRGTEDAEFSIAPRRESLRRPGMRIVIRDLLFNPTRLRGPLSPPSVQAFLAEKFDSDLRRGALSILIQTATGEWPVQPPPIDLPHIGKQLELLELPGTPERVARTQLWFDLSGAGRVGVRQAGVVVVADLAQDVPGLDSGVWGSGYIRGYIDADFLEPLPARSGFAANADWLKLSDMLIQAEPQLAEEVQALRREAERSGGSDLQAQAVRIAAEVLSLARFQELEMLGGLRRGVKRSSKSARASGKGASGQQGELGEGLVDAEASVGSEDSTPPEVSRTEEAARLLLGDGRAQAPSSESGKLPRPRIAVAEEPFLDEPHLHSRFVDGRVVVNTLNQDYQRAMHGDANRRLIYLSLLIGKEALAHNSLRANEDLERMLAFESEVRQQVLLARGSRGQRGQQARRGKGN